jgi:hypothetical protein
MAGCADHKIGDEEATGRKRRISDGPPPPMEQPLSHKPVERDGDDYKRRLRDDGE